MLKQGLETGMSATITVEVTPEMYAQFDGKVVHQAYSTVSLVYHLEWVSRLIILPYLENDEEGMGGAVTAKHIAPATLGEVVTLTATVTEIKDKNVYTKVEARKNDKLIGTGEVKQVILKKKKITELLTM